MKGREEKLDVSYFANTNIKIQNYLDELAFGFGLEQNDITSIHTCFGSVPVFYFMLYYDTIRAGLVASSNVLFLVFGFSEIIYVRRIRLYCKQYVGVDTTGRGKRELGFAVMMIQHMIQMIQNNTYIL